MQVCAKTLAGVLVSRVPLKMESEVVRVKVKGNVRMERDAKGR
jgi:hypothetical protein